MGIMGFHNNQSKSSPRECLCYVSPNIRGFKSQILFNPQNKFVVSIIKSAYR